jgi:pyridoxal phosphate enzyme (YggS family)
MSIQKNYEKLRKEVPEHVVIIAAAKTRTIYEVEEAIDAGVNDVGENYVQEAARLRESLGEKASRVRWHMIGHLQTNKINKALNIFDMIQTVDSIEQAESIHRRAANMQKVVSVLIEINSGGELSKSGLKPEDEPVEQLVRAAAQMKHIRVDGIMTMGPLFEDPERMRPYFRKTRNIFQRIRSLGIEGLHFNTLSMGMSDSYRVAIEEGSTMIRIGTLLFGPRY